MSSRRDEFKQALIAFVSGPLFARHAKLARPFAIDGTTPLCESFCDDETEVAP